MNAFKSFKKQFRVFTSYISLNIKMRTHTQTYIYLKKSEEIPTNAIYYAIYFTPLNYVLSHGEFLYRKEIY